MKCSTLYVTLLFSALFSFQAWGVSCPYAAFTPPAVYNHSLALLGERGIAVVPRGLGFSQAVAGSDRDIMVKGGRLVGMIGHGIVPRVGISGVQFLDAHGMLLAELNETSFPCPPSDPRGLCRQVTFTTSRDASTQAAAPPFTIIDVRGSLEYYRYGHETDVSSWRYEFGESMHWLVVTLADAQDSLPILPAGTRVDRFMASLVSDPEVIPYLGYIHIGEDCGRIVITGRLTSSIYGLIVDDAILAGFPDIVMDVTTDSGLPPLVYDRAFIECLPE